jgi:hypothetical protein
LASAVALSVEERRNGVFRNPASWKNLVADAFERGLARALTAFDLVRKWIVWFENK